MSTYKQKNNNIEKVKKASFDCFKDKGIFGMNQNEIAISAGLSLRSLNNYFKSKEDLCKQTIEYALKEEFDTIHIYEMDPYENPKKGFEVLSDFLKEQKQIFAKSYMEQLLLRESEIFALRNEGQEQILKMIFEKIQNQSSFLKRALKKGIEDGSIKPDIDIDAVSLTILQSFMGQMEKAATMVFAAEPHKRDEVIHCSLMSIDILDRMILDFIKNPEC